MKIPLAYGEATLEIELPEERVEVIEPSHEPGLADERAALEAALSEPIGARPLRDWIRPEASICIVFTDITRATPNERLIPWLLEHLQRCGAKRDNILLLNALGTHRPNSQAELERLLTPEVVARYRVLNHEPENPAALTAVGTTRTGRPALLNTNLVRADVRIVTGFIEPHFFAGFSGGPKGIMPGVAGLETVKSNHGPRQIGDANAAFGILDGNPIWEEMRDIAQRPGPSFLVNVTLNAGRQITGVFAGDLIEAHRAGVAHVRRSAMQKVARPFEVVVTTNSGYPLDQNLYQSVKGMAAAARVVRAGGAIVVAAECRNGVPDGSPYERLLESARDATELFERTNDPDFEAAEQWQAQIQACIQKRAEVHLFSGLPDATVRRAHLTPCPDVAATAVALLERAGPDARAAVLPQGPLTIPYLEA